MTAEEYLDTVEVSQAYGLSISYLTKLRHHGGGPKYLKVGGKVIYKTGFVETWLDSHVTKSTSDPKE